MLEKLRLKKFCCCCDLKTGSLTIATFGWISSLTAILGTLLIWMLEEKKTEESVEENTERLIMNGLYIFYYVFCFCLNVVLVVGITKEKRNFMLSWLYISYLQLIIVYLYIPGYVVYMTLFLNKPEEAFAHILLVLILVAVLVTYFWLCVWSHFQNLEDASVPHWTPPPTPQTVQAEERSPYREINPYEIGWKLPPENSFH